MPGGPQTAAHAGGTFAPRNSHSRPLPRREATLMLRRTGHEVETRKDDAAENPRIRLKNVIGSPRMYFLLARPVRALEFEFAFASIDS